MTAYNEASHMDFLFVGVCVSGVSSVGVSEVSEVSGVSGVSSVEGVGLCRCALTLLDTIHGWLLSRPLDTVRHWCWSVGPECRLTLVSECRAVSGGVGIECRSVEPRLKLSAVRPVRIQHCQALSALSGVVRRCQLSGLSGSSTVRCCQGAVGMSDTLECTK